MRSFLHDVLLVALATGTAVACGGSGSGSKKKAGVSDPTAIFGDLFSPIGKTELVGRVQPTATALKATVPVAAGNLHLFVVGPRIVFWDETLKQSAVYETTTKEWWAVPVDDALLQRYGATLAATDKGIFFWGGEVGSKRVSDGAFFDLTTRAWKPLAATGAPTPRTNGIGLWTGDRVIVFAGTATDDNKVLVKETYAYLPASDSWSALAPLPVAEIGGAYSGDHAAVLADGKAYYFSSGKSFVLDLTANAWTPLQGPRLSTGDTVHFDGARFVTVPRIQITESTALERLALADVAAATRSTSGQGFPVAGPLEAFCVAAAGPRVAVWGGRISSSWDGATDYELDSGWVYETDVDRWTHLRPVAGIGVRSGAKCVVFGDQLLVWGGYTGGLDIGEPTTPVTDGFLLDLPARAALDAAAAAAAVTPAASAAEDPPLPDCLPGQARVVGTIGGAPIDIAASASFLFVQGDMTLWLGGQGSKGTAISVLFPSGLANGHAEPAWIGMESATTPSLVGGNCRFDPPASELTISEDGKSYHFHVRGPYYKGLHQIVGCAGEALDVHLSGCAQGRQ